MLASCRSLSRRPTVGSLALFSLVALVATLGGACAPKDAPPAQGVNLATPGSAAGTPGTAAVGSSSISDNFDNGNTAGIANFSDLSGH